LAKGAGNPGGKQSSTGASMSNGDGMAGSDFGCVNDCVKDGVKDGVKDCVSVNVCVSKMIAVEDRWAAHT